MRKEFYYVYCKNILGVKTNTDGFRWIYGSTAQTTSIEEYSKCVVKIELSIKPEKELGNLPRCNKRFQSYSWDKETQTIYCRRTFLHCLKIGYNIRIDGNTIYAEVGQNYYRYVQNRTMNLHGMYYLLSDLANVVLLKNGYLSLYASAVYNKMLNKGIVHFAPPNTGKTVTVTELSELSGYRIVSEDIVITDGNKLYSCPWTSSYRNNLKMIDNAGSLSRVKKQNDRQVQDSCKLTDLVVLALGEDKISTDKDEILELIYILNGYLFGYYSTPIIKILSYFNKEYRKMWSELSVNILKKMITDCNCHLIQEETSIRFAKKIDDIVRHKYSGDLR